MKKGKKLIKLGSWGVFIVYLVSLAYFLFFSERYGRGVSNMGYRYNLQLFKEINRFVKYREMIGLESFVVNILGNVFAFSPFGFFLPIISEKSRNFFQVLILSFELSLTIELVQLAYKVGIFDVDDLFMNTLGGVIGYLCFAIAYKLYGRRKKRGRKE